MTASLPWPGRRARLLAGIALVLAGGPGPAAGYELRLQDGARLSVDDVTVVDGRPVAVRADESWPMDELDVDHVETVLANQDGTGGNVLFLRTGGWLRFERLSLHEGRLTVVLDGDNSVVLDQESVDFRRMVRQAATLRIAEGATDTIMTAKAKTRPRRSPSRRPRRR